MNDGSELIAADFEAADCVGADSACWEGLVPAIHDGPSTLEMSAEVALGCA